jgi:creatinine amidohydrolase
MSKTPKILDQLTWQQVDSYLNSSQMIIIPLGAIEQHGPSCPLGTDKILAEYISKRVGEAAGVLVGPCMPIGDSLAHCAFPGTIALRPSTLMAVVRDYVNSLYGAGFRRFLLLGTHWDNHFPVAASLSELADEKSDLRFIVKDFWEFPSVATIMKEEFDESGGHADAADASLLLAIDEKLVNKSLLTAEFPPVAYQVSRELIRPLVTSSGVIGSDQRKASLKAGKRLMKEIISSYVNTVDDLRH